ncbi:hypothetical protein RN001_015045 [Aquatica leii]|uniref:HAT C-terminal dimerisation domain-containing protein n=1 Tax=Aquatica leii TaxID=1421715 RepID=A0AAN7S6H1_9COLE|nr:hypothetical protein RN001_015045 [Aquatica leii]
MDTALNSIDERFDLMRNHNDVFGFLNRLKTITKEELQKYCDDLTLKLTDNERNHCDVDGVQLFEETKSLQVFLSDDMTAIDVLTYLVINDLISIFPNTSVVLRIFLTLPVTVSSNKRSFSKLKIIKNYLRTTMSQDRLSNLAFISIEHETVDTLDLNEVIDSFASMKARKIEF